MSTTLEILPTMKCKIEKLDASICVREWQKNRLIPNTNPKHAGTTAITVVWSWSMTQFFLWASYNIQSPTEIESNTLDHCWASTSLYNVWSATEWSAIEPNVIDAKSIRSF